MDVPKTGSRIGHKLVCTGAVSLAEAQAAIARDWIAAYQKYVEER